MTIKESIEQAVDKNDAHEAMLLADCLRERGLNYAAGLRLVQRVRPSVTGAQWGELMRRADDCAAQEPCGRCGL